MPLASIPEWGHQLCLFPGACAVSQAASLLSRVSCSSYICSPSSVPSLPLPFLFVWGNQCFANRSLLHLFSGIFGRSKSKHRDGSTLSSLLWKSLLLWFLLVILIILDPSRAQWIHLIGTKDKFTGTLLFFLTSLPHNHRYLVSISRLWLFFYRLMTGGHCASCMFSTCSCSVFHVPETVSLKCDLVSHSHSNLLRRTKWRWRKWRGQSRKVLDKSPNDLPVKVGLTNLWFHNILLWKSKP